MSELDDFIELGLGGLPAAAARKVHAKDALLQWQDLARYRAAAAEGRQECVVLLLPIAELGFFAEVALEGAQALRFVEERVEDDVTATVGVSVLGRSFAISICEFE